MQYEGMRPHAWRPQPPVELRSVDPAQNPFRRYRLTVQGTLFNAVDLVVEWGRLGRVPRVRIERFTDQDRLDARWRELVSRRRRHGYEPISDRLQETSGRSRPTGESWTALPPAGDLR